MAPEEKELSFGRLLEICRGLYKQAKRNIKQDEVSFQQVAINARYYHSLLMDEIQRMDATGVEVQLRGKGRVQILEELQNFGQQDLDWDYLGTCYNTLVKDTIAYDSPAPRLFIILPADLDAWDDLDSVTHIFRLYFLCDTKNEDSPRYHLPKHVHLSDHEGYSLKRPQEFMQAYGNYVLRILEAINRGYSDENIEIPYIDSFKILWKHIPRVGSKFSKDTFRPLVDKSIAYLQKTPRPELFSDLALSRSECALIKTFLDVQGCDNTTGNLHRYIDQNQYVYWMCQAHAQQGAHSASLAGLESFVRSHGGHVDMHQATLSVRLKSIAQTDRLCTLLLHTKFIFNVSVNLCWNVTRLDVEKFCQDLNKTKTVCLEIDGITPDIHPKDYVQYMTNLFATSIIPKTNFQIITLLNYPLSQVKSIYTGGCSLTTSLSRPVPEWMMYGWTDLRRDLIDFRVMISVAHVASSCKSKIKGLRKTLRTFGYADFGEVKIHEEHWEATCDLNTHYVDTMHLFNTGNNAGLADMGILRRLTVDITDPEFDSELDSIVYANAGLQELAVSVLGSDEVGQVAEQIARTWNSVYSTLHLTLFERTMDQRARNYVEVEFAGKRPSPPMPDAHKSPLAEDCSSSNLQRQDQDFPLNIDVLQWACDHVSKFRSDISAFVLRMASFRHPTVLTSLILDVSSLSSTGVLHVQNIFRQSSLDHLTVMCTPFDPSLLESITQTLHAVQWPMLKSFMLIGDHINDWLALWSTHETQLTLIDPFMAPRLLRVHVQGSGSVQHQLSHVSILFLHQLIDASPLAELYFQNVLLLDKRDWALIVESIDSLLLETLNLCPGSTRQLQDSGEAWEVFQAKFEMAE